MTSSPSTVGGSEGNGENPEALPAEPDVVCIIDDSDSDQDKDEITKDISSTVDRQTPGKKGNNNDIAIDLLDVEDPPPEEESNINSIPSNAIVTEIDASF